MRLFFNTLTISRLKYMNTALNIGIFAHVDAGKTTLTEQLLFKSNNIKTLGQVDKGSSVSDSLNVEKQRGISVQNSSLSFNYKNRLINVIDTPGHIDFSAELDRIFSVIDVGIVIISAVEGIQGQTLRIMECLQERKIPILIFINKIDRIGADPDMVFHQIKQEFKIPPFLINEKVNSPKLFDESLENLAEIDESFMELYLDDKIPSTSELTVNVLKQTFSTNIYPTFLGSAKEDKGINDLLDFIADIQLNAKPIYGHSLYVFKVDYSTKIGVQYHVKNFGESILPKTKIKYLDEQISINEITKNSGQKNIRLNELNYNDIAIVTLSKAISLGSFLGESVGQIEYKKLTQDALKVEILANNEADYIKLSEALTLLNIENPDLNLNWNKNLKTFQISIQGEIQIEIIQEILQTRFDLSTETKPIQVQYKETPKKAAEGYVRYWMPKPCWAIMTFLIEPGEPNSGVEFESKVNLNDISSKYQNEIKRAIPKSLKQGIKGWPITDIKITLIKGEEHQVHSNPGDFLLATPMGVLRGIELADTELLEPYYKISMKFNADLLGSIHTLINKVDGQILDSVFQEEDVLLECKAPVEKSLKFPISFNSLTSGKGRLIMKLDSYQKAENSEEKHQAYNGVNPLDEAQWILHNRGAYKADERQK